MALPIKNIPVLTKKALKRFNSLLKKTKKESVNFSKEFKTYKQILNKSKNKF